MANKLWHGLRLALLGAAAFLAAEAHAGSLEFIVDRADGAVYIKNPTASPVTLDGYQVLSFGDALIVDNWTPIAGNYDTQGDQSVDATAEWFVINDPSTGFVAEASTVAESGSVAPGQIVSLGLFFNLSLLEGFVVTTSSGSDTEQFPASFRTLDADADNDLDVDLDDYAIFAATYGSTTDLRIDANHDGVIDAADYTVWRDTLTPAATSVALAGLSIPEPGAWLLTVSALAAASSSRRRRAG